MAPVRTTERRPSYSRWRSVSSTRRGADATSGKPSRRSSSSQTTRCGSSSSMAAARPSQTSLVSWARPPTSARTSSRLTMLGSPLPASACASSSSSTLRSRRRRRRFPQAISTCDQSGCTRMARLMRRGCCPPPASAEACCWRKAPSCEDISATRGRAATAAPAIASAMLVRPTPGPRAAVLPWRVTARSRRRASLRSRRSTSSRSPAEKPNWRVASSSRWCASSMIRWSYGGRTRPPWAMSERRRAWFTTTRWAASAR